ncbi:site-2 protease family protein [Phycicoccus sp. BSK3Z-2]|uniref:Site-2 protease family protein n=1 Tax=Phycicoccus avicenniae TaxID=2828860 RepID=A0A941D5J5_9MICO|nr:site-2 protease family protein [Phycicoccus avicenniae]MBR7742285.1 site-2 protease family protein [Phycicoccus avicenniae]
MSSAPEAPRGSLRIGSVAGVPVHLDRTWLLLALVIGFLGYQSGSALGPGIGLAYAVWLVVGIFVAVLGHEAGHALVARALGFRVHRIVATLWGGHTSYDATGATPWRTALVALAGPAVNGALAAAGLVASIVLDGTASSFAWAFGFLNGLLAVFNLLPGLPLDGGAAVQSAVWGATGRRDRGLLVAGWIGRAVAVLVVLWVLGRPLLAGTLPDLFDLFIGVVMGWILWTGASAAIARAPLEQLVHTVRVADVAQPAVVLPSETPLATARTRPGIVVCPDEHGRPTLVLTGVEGPVDPQVPLSALVTRVPDGNVVEVGPDDLLVPVLQAMSSTQVPIVVLTRDGGRVWAVTSAGHVDAVAKRSSART